MTQGDREFLETLEKRLSRLVKKYMIPGIKRVDESFWNDLMLCLSEVRWELKKLGQ